MSDDPSVTPRPAATVMLLRDTPGGPAVFLLQRHSRMDFAPGTTVFPGGGVDDRDRDFDIAWSGPEPSWWAQRMAFDDDLALALVCAAVRETFEECGVLLAGRDEHSVVGDATAYGSARDQLASNELALSDFLRGENLVLRSDLLRPWANWVTPAKGHRRRYDTYFFVAALPEGQHADGRTTEAASAGWSLPSTAIEEFAAGNSMLMPPTWTQLDTLGRFGETVDDILTVEREIVAMRTEVAGSEGNWSLEFFDSERYKKLLGARRWS
ncbi:MAG TPA: NUDIX hydrolase [Mycobacterium sp.]|jgi:8-oxo-dGTP pyrophosphatase MutT (NUDIX family)